MLNLIRKKMSNMGKKNVNLVYHYCTLETFMEIIKNHNIRFAAIDQSNDSDELLFAIKIYEKIAGEKTSMDYFMKENIKNNKHFCLCLSRAKDSLNMWRGYAPNGGIALGFNEARLIDYFKTNIKDYYNNNIITTSCNINYVNLDKIDDETKKEFEEIKTMTEVNNKAIKYKDISFHDESEVRIYFEMPIKYINESIEKNTYSKSLMFNGKEIKQIKQGKYYYDIPIDLSLIEEIIVGPKVNFMGFTNGVTDNIYSFLLANNEYVEFEHLKKRNIVLTKLTYR